MRLRLHFLPKKMTRGYVVAIVCSFVAGILVCLGSIALLDRTHTVPAGGLLRQSDIPTARSEYTFIDPLLASKGGNPLPKYNEMKEQLSSYLSSQKDSGLISATVYFRDINEQGELSINGDELYTPASLFKVPVMMTYYKIAERNPAILTDRIYFAGETDHNSVEQIKSVVQLKPGTTYTVEQLIEHLIRYSDNNAVHLLTQHLLDTQNLNDYAEVFSDLGIDLKSMKDYSDSITAQQYSLFLRSLYNATYLNRTYSEKALALLSNTDFTEGIESGVPNEISVAQKFGEVRMTDSNGVLLGKQLNNCGIIYYPKHPYLLCVMTKMKGDNVRGLEDTVSAVSRIVYKNVQSLYPY